MRERRRWKDRRNPLGRLGLVFSTLVSVLLAVGALFLALAYLDVARDLPSLEALPVLLDPVGGSLLTPTRLYDRSGERVILTLENPAAHEKEYLRYTTETQGEPGTLPEGLALATIATVDPTFWDNPGYSLQGITSGEQPTLAQRLVADLLLGQETPGVRRALRERLLAGQVVAAYGREQVLEWYLNSAQYGDLIYGADAAARVYFGKSASDLTLAESITLAVIAEMPEVNPQIMPHVVLERQREVIGLMRNLGLISPEEAQQAESEKVTFQPEVEAINLAPAFGEMVLEQLQGTYPTEMLKRGGLRIITTLDDDLQLQAACAAAAQVERLSGQDGEVLDFEGNPCQAALLLPTLVLAPGAFPEDLSAMLVVLHPHSGQVLAMVGGMAQNPARQPGYPAGSLLTPFLYLTGFTRGLAPATLLWDIPPSSQSTGLPATLPGFENPDDEYHGPVRLRTALANDYLVPAAQVIDQVGLENVVRVSRQFGLTSLDEIPSYIAPALSYFQAQVSLLEVTQAYGVLANQGLLAGQPLMDVRANNRSGAIFPSSVIRMEDLAGNVLLDWSDPQVQPIVNPQLAYLLTHILSDEPARWPSLGHPNPLEIGRPAGVKLGSSLDGRDAWTVGYLPERVVGVWMGSAVGEGKVNPLAAAGLWHAVMQYAARDLAVQGWNVPPGISQVNVCDPSGLLPTNNCPRVVREVFLAGSEPIQTDYLYQVYQINRETGRLATVFTPPELVEARVYLVVPQQAAKWAESAGLDIPPDSYDVIYAPPPVSPGVQISMPEMFSHVSGEISLIGSAYGADFSFYRVQIGQGLNPQSWIQLGESSAIPVEGGLLSKWDTRGLSGLYVLRLQVVYEGQRVETALLQVTIDNQPPVVNALNPFEGDSLQAQPGSSVVLQADVSDDLVLDRVEFYIDGQLVTSLLQPPFTTVWSAKLGEHTMRIRAYDLAGNLSEAVVQFAVK